MMRSFEHCHARTVEEACQLLAAHPQEAVLNAGGTDLLGLLKADCLPTYPRLVVNLKTITGLDVIREEAGGLFLGALLRLSDVTTSPLIRQGYPVLAEAARSVASPQIRNMATLGGNLCQETRCWYYRYPRRLGGPIVCARKGGIRCWAAKGDHRYHAIMGARRCLAACPSDTAVALAALDAWVRVAGPRGGRAVPVTEFFHPLGNALASDEMVVGVEVPRLSQPSRQRFIKFTLRRPIDFAVASVAVVVTEEDGVCAEARIALGAVAPGPVRARQAEESLKGKPLEEAVVARAAEEALASARPLPQNGYKVELVKALIRKALRPA